MSADTRAILHAERVRRGLRLEEDDPRVAHPITIAIILRENALSAVREVSADTRAILHAERVRRGLSLEEDDPLMPVDRDRYNATLQAVGNP